MNALFTYLRCCAGKAGRQGDVGTGLTADTLSHLLTITLAKNGGDQLFHTGDTSVNTLNAEIIESLDSTFVPSEQERCISLEKNGQELAFASIEFQ